MSGFPAEYYSLNMIFALGESNSLSRWLRQNGRGMFAFACVPDFHWPEIAEQQHYSLIKTFLFLKKTATIVANRLGRIQRNCRECPWNESQEDALVPALYRIHETEWSCRNDRHRPALRRFGLGTVASHESATIRGIGTTSSPADCSPPPSLSFPWLDDQGWSGSAKEELFCDIWDGKAMTLTLVFEVPSLVFSDRDDGINPVGYLNVEVASWDDLVNAGIKLNALKTAFTFFERKAKRARTQARLCGAACLVTWEAAALACLKFVNPKAILACEGLAASVLIACHS